MFYRSGWLRCDVGMVSGSCLSWFDVRCILYITIILHIHIYYYYILYIILYCLYILYSSSPIFSFPLSFCSPFLILYHSPLILLFLLPNIHLLSSFPIYFLSSLSSIYHSFNTCRYLDTLTYVQSSHSVSVENTLLASSSTII